MSRLILNFPYILLFDERLTKMIREIRKWPVTWAFTLLYARCLRFVFRQAFESFRNLHKEITKFMASVVIYESSQAAGRDVVSV